ncbi:MAG: trigger factor [Eubacteriales bacterium]
MVSSIEKVEKNVAIIKIEVAPEDFNKAIHQSYNKNKGKFNIPGFRKGKAPRNIIERHYGNNVFYEDAIDYAFPEAYTAAIKDHDLFPVARPAMESIESIDAKEGLVFTVSVAVKPEVELGEYKGTEIDTLTYDVTEEDVDNELRSMREKNARLVDVDHAPAKEGDTVIMDFEGFIDEVPFAGGKAENYSLILGSKTFIPGFEDQLMGITKNEEREIKVSFPESYQSEELAGKDAVFKVKCNEIKGKELPELDDEFVKDVSEFDTVEELRDDLKVKIQERKLKELKEFANAKVLNVAIENAVVEIPEPMIEEEVEKTLHDFEYQLKMQGIGMEDYFQYANVEKEKFMEEIRQDVIARIKKDLVLLKITEVENIEAAETDIDQEIIDYASTHKLELDKFKKTIKEEEKEYFQSIAKRKKTMAFLVDHAVQK